ncbi:uncharacterized protein [Apostichopus japonicus]|uniref:uncharacterized protein isoform X2 n=1 Tax=Stichopus japonicus TaxID=307972 RepID=UPI003AB41F7A
MPSFAMTTSTAKSFGGNQMPGTSTSSSVISVNSADKYMSDYIDIMEPEDDSYASDEDLKAIIEESLRDLDNTSDIGAMEAKMLQIIELFQSKRESEKLIVVVRRKKILRSASEVAINQSGFFFLKEPVVYSLGRMQWTSGDLKDYLHRSYQT